MGWLIEWITGDIFDAVVDAAYRRYGWLGILAAILLIFCLLAVPILLLVMLAG